MSDARACIVRTSQWNTQELNSHRNQMWNSNTADVWAISMVCHPRVTCHIVGCCHLANFMSWSQTYVSHCRVLPPGEFNGMPSQSHVSRHLVNSLSWFQSYMPHCRVQSPGKINVMTVHIAGCNNSIRHIENRFSPHFIYLFFCCFNAVWALTSDSFRVVFDTLVWKVLLSELVR